MADDPRLKIILLDGWHEQKNHGPATYRRATSSDPGALQFSFAQHRAGPLPNVGKVNLLEICRKMAGRLPGGRIISEHSGVCSFGEFGTAVARGDSPRYFQVWVLSNNREFILVTHTCDTEPDPNEISEAKEIVMMTTCK